MLHNITLKDVTKLITLISVIAVSTALGIMAVLPGEAVAGIISACLGYVFGNGHAVIEHATVCKHCGRKV